jgi:transcription initiation factor IIF auxiliary subunit
MSSGNKRIKGISVSRPIYFGSVAAPLNGKKASDPDHTHKWTVMIKGLNNEDLSYYIKKVVFKLHETYPNPLRSKQYSLKTRKLTKKKWYFFLFSC